MTAYFDPVGDANLLAMANRGAQDLANVAADVEADVIGFFTRREPERFFTARVPGPLAGTATQVNSTFGIFVYLRGYTVDAADPTCDPQLKDALKRTIADVINWRFAQRSLPNLLARSQSDNAGRNVTARDDATSLFPRGFERRLRKFDSREPVWGS